MKWLNLNDLKEALIKTWNALKGSFFILLGVMLLIGLTLTIIPTDFFASLITGNVFLDSFFGALFGSILAGNPVTSYVLAGELMNTGISLVAVTAFILAWVTVGVIQFPAESMMLGKKFAFVRNLVSFVFAIIIAILTVVITGFFS